MSDNSKTQFIFADTVERRNAIRGCNMEETILINTVEEEEGEYIKIRECESYSPEEKKPWPKTDVVIKSTKNTSN